MSRQFHVYIMGSVSKTLYTGVTNGIERRVHEHKMGITPGFSRRYRITKLVYAEPCSNALDAIRREKQIKGWKRERKIALIEEGNPEWEDLAEGWFAENARPS